MQLPKNDRTQRAQARNGRLASQFVKRLKKGLLIDRTAQAVGSKAPKMIALPKLF